MSSASSNQSFVRDGAGYEELYPSGCRDPDELSERSPSAASVGKSGFVSHSKHTAEATNMDLFYS